MIGSQWRSVRARAMREMSGRRRGFSLVELLMVVVLMGIISSMVVSRFDPAISDQLEGVARVLVSDLDYARGLAVANNSNYTVSLGRITNRYHLQHTGTNGVLDALPKSAYLVDGFDSTNKPRQTAEIGELLTYGPTVRLHVIRRSPSKTAAGTVEFTPLGGTTAAEDTEVWFICGEGTNARYVCVTVNRVTGLSTVGPVLVAVP